MSLNAPGTYVVCAILPWIGTTTLLARMRVRLLQKAKLQTDDWTACAGMIVMWAVSGMIIAGTAKGLFGHHTLQDPETGEAVRTPTDLENIKYMQIVLIISILAIGLIKLSVVFLYRRIFSISQIFNIYSVFLLALIVVWTVVFLLANIFQCGTHPESVWTSVKMILKYCDDTSGATAALALSDLIMDLMIVAAPMPIVWRLQMTTAQKFQITGIFALGIFATAASAVRAYIFLVDSYGTTLGYRDIQGENTKIVAWSLIEIAAALMGSCLPTLRPLFANTSFGSFLGTIFSVLSLHSRMSKSSKEGQEEEEVTVVTIGGTRAKLAPVHEKNRKDSSLEPKDVGNIA